MDGTELLKSISKDGLGFREVESSVYSALSVDDSGHAYDSKVGFYDAVSGIASIVLDAGCGSLVFTHEVYARYSARPVCFAGPEMCGLALDGGPARKTSISVGA